MNPIRNGGRQDLLSLHLDVALPRPRASISVTALRFSHQEVLEQRERKSWTHLEHWDSGTVGHAQNDAIEGTGSRMAGRQKWQKGKCKCPRRKCHIRIV